MRSSAHYSPAHAEAKTAPNSAPNVSHVLMGSAPASVADSTTPRWRRAERGAGCWADPPNRARPPITQLASEVWFSHAPPVTTTLRASPPGAVRRPMSTSATSTDAEGLVRGTYAPPSG